MAPPKKPIDMEMVRKLAMIQCTEVEIASVLGVHRTTLIKNEDFQAVYKETLEIGRMSLRRKQFSVALAGDRTMLIWLGKQYLKQADKQEIIGDLGIRKSVKELTDAELDEAIQRFGVGTRSKSPQVGAALPA